MSPLDEDEAVTDPVDKELAYETLYWELLDANDDGEVSSEAVMRLIRAWERGSYPALFKRLGEEVATGDASGKTFERIGRTIARFADL